jgi:hypothetical protein
MAAVISDNNNARDGMNTREDPSELEVVAESNRGNEMASSIAM